MKYQDIDPLEAYMQEVELILSEPTISKGEQIEAEDPLSNMNSNPPSLPEDQYINEDEIDIGLLKKQSKTLLTLNAVNYSTQNYKPFRKVSSI